MKKYIGSIATDICNELIAECSKHTVEPYYGNMNLKPDDKFYKEHLEQKQLAIKAGYVDSNSVEFRHYYPEKHFSLDFVKEFEDATNTKSLLSFVSEIRPGKCAPWHWDINPWLDKYPAGNIVRYACFIDVPKHGQAFMIEDECFYMEKQGSIYQYPSLYSWHAGFNAGLETKFLFTITGLEKV
jgi:hypothetical protein